MVEFVSAEFTAEYKTKWNILDNSKKKFVYLMVDGIKQLDNLFCITNSTDVNGTYININVCNESIDFGINNIKETSCIINQAGNIKLIEKDCFTRLHLIPNSIFCFVGSTIVNIETSEIIGNSYGALSSNGFLFINAGYKTVLKVNKLSGESELFL